MRLRIQSIPPLPDVKVWYTFQGEEGKTVANLKSDLARDVFALRKHAPLDLSLDGFRFLDSSSLDVLRDGDLIIVKMAEAESSKRTEGSKKRKRSSSPVRRTQTKPPSLPLLSLTPSSSSSSSSSSSAASSSSSSSSDDSDSDSDSSSSSSSSSTPPTSASYKCSSVPQTQTARRTFIQPPAAQPPAATSTTTIPVATKPMVPPGKGKPSTHSRNVRRRIKRVANASVPTPMPDFVSQTNATPVAVPEPEAERRRRRIHGPGPDVASALNNAFGGNERAGRLDPGTLARAASPSASSPSSVPTPQYPPTEAEETLHVQMMSMLPKSKNKNKSRRVAEDVDPRSRKIVFGTPPPFEGETPRVQRPALIPPSSLPLHLIPSNVFITYVDVEEGLKKPKKKKRRVEEEEVWVMDEVVPDPTVLDYGEAAPEIETSGDDVGLDPSMFDFDAAPLITSPAQLTEGCIVGFTGLTINIETCAPEVGRRYGRVLTWTDEYRVTIRPMFMGGGLEDEDEHFGWKQVEGIWKLLQ
ncbi:hypothetical protein B0H17DRAFT_1056639 [Mycena rosella]|uniref:Coilin n=1 Tax=Mycena rosella TaxID=1033263 RepID=A0AAD7DMD0_MYCRO|nr:hypothetical protein B0H17DRAFT_1056639 [Mycena rosella]